MFSTQNYGYNKELKTYVVLGRKCLFIGRFKQKLFCAIDGKKLLTPKKVRNERLHHIEWIYESIFTGKRHLSQLTRLWTKHCLASSRDKIPFIFEKGLKVITRKEFDVLELF